MPDVAGEVLTAILDESEAHIQETGQVPRPQVHILAEDMDEPFQYVGYITTRPFYRGTDAATAIADLGRLPSALAATRLFVVWEEDDLRLALEMPNRHPAHGLSVVDVRSDGHTVLWLPFEVAQDGADTVVTWGTPTRHENVKLHAPIEALIDTWRTPSEDLERTVLDLQGSGYQIKWSIAFKS
ncbi:hypothetical protein ABZ436_08410 [Micromonospora matsumotoense]|uniref:hypothetical protein n=1 Tax=Micromonospora matsumotoense TaxID=121616 RepID=UPI0033C360AB